MSEAWTTDCSPAERGTSPNTSAGALKSEFMKPAMREGVLKSASTPPCASISGHAPAPPVKELVWASERLMPTVTTAPLKVFWLATNAMTWASVAPEEGERPTMRKPPAGAPPDCVR